MALPNWTKAAGRQLAAGFEVSAIGGVVAIVLLALLARMSSMPWYSYGNLFATGLYPDTVLDERAGYWTAAGFALAFLYCMVAGMLFACLFWARRTGAGPHLVGVTYALALFLLGDRYWWQLVSPYIIIYAVHGHLMWTHVVFGVVLGLLPRRRAYHEERGVSSEHGPADEEMLLDGHA